MLAFYKNEGVIYKFRLQKWRVTLRKTSEYELYSYKGSIIILHSLIKRYFYNIKKKEYKYFSN